MNSNLLLWIAFTLTCFSAVPRYAVPCWIPLLLVILALLLR